MHHFNAHYLPTLSPRHCQLQENDFHPLLSKRQIPGYNIEVYLTGELATCFPSRVTPHMVLIKP